MIKVYRLLITLFIIVISLSKASAQIGALFKNIDEAEILAGTSLVTLRGVDFREYKTVKFGYSAGISASWQLMKKAGVSVGILYEQCD